MGERKWKVGDVGITGNKYGHETPTRFFVGQQDGSLVFRYEDGDVAAFAPRHDAHLLMAIDPDDRKAVERLARLYASTAHLLFPGEDRRTDDFQAALREFADPKPMKPKCVAHGNEACPSCSQIADIAIEDGGCRSCGTYAETGMHWDTCPYRIRGRVYANREEATS